MYVSLSDEALVLVNDLVAVDVHGRHVRWLPLPPAIAERAIQMEPFVNA